MRMGTLLGVTDLVGSPESVKFARQFVKLKLGEDHPALDDVTLLVSETVTNAAIHSNSKNNGKITLVLADCHDFIHVDVLDAGGESVPEVRGGLFGEGGRGLMLVDVIAYKWGICEDDQGRTVWFQVKYERRTTDAVRACPKRRESAP